MFPFEVPFWGFPLESYSGDSPWRVILGLLLGRELLGISICHVILMLSIGRGNLQFIVNDNITERKVSSVARFLPFDDSYFCTLPRQTPTLICASMDILTRCKISTEWRTCCFPRLFSSFTAKWHDHHIWHLTWITDTVLMSKLEVGGYNNHIGLTDSPR